MRKNDLNTDRLTIPQIGVLWVFTLFTVALMMLPMWNVLVVSTSSTFSSTQSGVVLWWRQFSMEGYAYVFEITKLLRPFLNSLFVTSVGTVAQVMFSGIAGYVLIHEDMPYRRLMMSFILLTMMIPGDLTLISVYQLNKSLGMLNTYAGLILNGMVSGFSILLMRNFFLSISYSLAESARIDGASELSIFLRIYVPAALPGLATVFFMEFVAKWNTIALPAAILTKESMYTLPLMLKMMIMSTSSVSGVAQVPQNAIMAAIVISVVPLVGIYIFAQQFLLSGLNLGASKE